MHRAIIVRLAGLAALAPLALLSGAQTPAGAPPATPTERPSSAAPAEQKPAASREDHSLPPALRDAPPAVVLGVRVEAIRRNLAVQPTLVIVPNAAAYVEAIARWTVAARFPVLIDDGTDTAQEHIARFVRGFKPTSVVRWDGVRQGDGVAPTREAIAGAHAAAWGAADAAGFRAKLKELDLTPVGVVVMSESDPAWTGGLALAAGRGQPIIWSGRAPENLGSILGEQEATGIAKALSDELDRLGYPWREAGDAIEAVTICHNMGGRVQTPAGIVALTDLLGRSDRAAEPNKPMPRAYAAGLLFGNHVESAYRAMCGLFVQPAKAWLVNGYEGSTDDPKTRGFALYNPAAAAELLKKAGITPTLDDTRDVLRVWRQRGRDGVDAGLIHVNSAGQRRQFLLKGLETDAAEIPQLRAPAIVHFIHSFSAQDMNDRQSIAPRWLENGAYAYVGSVDEPFLSAFTTPETLAVRLLAPAPLAAAARVDNAKPWKINVYGDPLATLGPPAKRAEGAPNLPGTPPTPLEDWMKAALKDKRLLDAVRALVMLGRDADAARIYEAARAQDPKAATPELSVAAFWAATRVPTTAGADDAADAYLWMTPDRAKDPRVLDALWLALRPALEGEPSRKVVDTLLPRMRPQTVVDDATALAKAAQRLDGREAGREVILRAVNLAGDPATKQKLQERLKLF